MDSASAKAAAHPEHRRRFRIPGLQITGLGLLLCAGIVLATGLGYVAVGWQDILRILAAKVFGLDGLTARMDELLPVVVMEVRLPRILTAAVVGGGLAVSGVVFQGILLNPLADPYTLGVSAGAAFGASLAILLNLGLAGAYSVSLFAFLGAAATLFLVLYLASTGRIGSNETFSSNNLILSGIMVAAILAAGISFLKYLAGEQVAVIIFWLMGSFAAKTWADLGLVTILIGLGFIVFLFYGRDLNVLALGTRTAATLGVNTRKTPLILLVTASLVAAACVAVSGIIGFVGLLVPHMVRAATGPDNRSLLPVSLLAGAVLLLGADTLVRVALPGEVPIGVLTALIGGPFFCYLFRRRQMGRMG